MTRRPGPAQWTVGLLAALAVSNRAFAIDERLEAVHGSEPAPELFADGTSVKLTPSLYFTTHEPTAFDINARATRGPDVAWVGFYRQAEVFQQFRAGYERTFSLPFGRLVGSAQAASRGFLGGSITAEIGDERWFGLAGWGATNQKPYFNLNFDPNDMIMLGAGTRALADTSIALFQIRGDRVAAGQRVTHLVARTGSAERLRWTFDLSYKTAPATDDAPAVRATGLGITCDFGPYFARLAYDPKVNFTPDNMWRVALGARF